MDIDEREIRELIEKWLDATRAGDTKSVLDMMTEDVVFLVAGAKPFGKSEFKEKSAEHVSSNIVFDGRSEIIELKVVADHAYIITKLSVRARESEKQLWSRSGYTLTILRKENGKWRLARDANLLSEDK